MSKQGESDNSAHVYPNMPMPSAPPTYDQAVAQAPGQVQIGFFTPAQGSSYPPQGQGQMYPSVPPQSSVSAAKYAPEYPPQAPTTTVVIRQQPTTFAPGPRPMRITCPNCHEHVLTTTETDCLCAAHFCCLALFLVGLGICSCIPYCMDNCKSVSHRCPNCKVDLGTYVPS